MRVFVAIDIDADVKKGLTSLQKKISAEAGLGRGDAKAVEPAAMHLTLKFLGEIKDEKSVEICNIAGQVAGRHKGFDMQVESVGSFGGRSARVVWVGLGAGAAELAELQKDLEEGLAAAGWPREEREFAGHLTLFRVKSPKAGVALSAICEKYRDYKVGFSYADEITVYQSVLTPQGPVYTALGKYKLS